MRQEFFGYKILSLAFVIIFSTIGYAQTERPLTWQDGYFPQFDITIDPGDLEKLLKEGETAKFPITLNYQDKIYDATIRQRGFGSSFCGDKRQFRIDFKSKLTLPDGYVTDRFETDRGNCYTMHEWMAWRLLDKAAEKHPELKLLRKKSNLTAVSFNGQLYHVQTLLEDVGKDILEPQLGTRNLKTFKAGCYGRMELQTDIDEFCANFSPAYLQSAMDIKSFLYSTAAMQVLGSTDNYPSYPYNYYFVRTINDGKIWFMPDDLDQTINSYDGAYWNPYKTFYSDNKSQGQFLALLNDPESRQLYAGYVQELTSLLKPDEVKPMVEAKYSQIRDTLLASPDLPMWYEFYDYVYQYEVPTWIDERYNFLLNVSPDEGGGTVNHAPTAKMTEIPGIIEAQDSEGATIIVNGSLSTDPDSDSLSYTWYLNNQETSSAALIEVKLPIGTHSIFLKVIDGKGGESVTVPVVFQIIPKVVEVINRSPIARMIELPTTIEVTDGEDVPISLDGSPSSDPDADSLSYTWYLNDQEIARTVIAGIKLSPGSYTIILKVEDGKGGVSVTAPFTIQILSNPFVITSVDQAQLQKGNTEILTIRGTGFVTGARVSLGPQINVDVPFALSSTSLSVRLFVLSSASVGARDVIVTNPDGKEATLYNGLYIE